MGLPLASVSTNSSLPLSVTFAYFPLCINFSPRCAAATAFALSGPSGTELSLPSRKAANTAAQAGERSASTAT